MGVVGALMDPEGNGPFLSAQSNIAFPCCECILLNGGKCCCWEKKLQGGNFKNESLQASSYQSVQYTYLFFTVSGVNGVSKTLSGCPSSQGN